MQETLSYQEPSQAFLGKAREELEAGDLEQASEKAWGAAAVMVKAVAEARGGGYVTSHIRASQDLWILSPMKRTMSIYATCSMLPSPSTESFTRTILVSEVCGGG